MEFAIKTKQWGAVSGCLLELSSTMRYMDKDDQVSFGKIISKCMRLPAARVRRAAAECVGQDKDNRFQEPLLALLNDEDPRVRSAAIAALARQGDKRAASKIKQMAISDPAFPVRQLSQYALPYIENGWKFQ